MADTVKHVKLPERCRRGNTFGPFTVTFTQDDGVTPVYASTATVLSVVRGGPENEGWPVLATLATGVFSAASLFLPATTTGTIFPTGKNTYWYDIKVTDGAVVDTIAEGPFPVDSGIS